MLGLTAVSGILREAFSALKGVGESGRSVGERRAWRTARGVAALLVILSILGLGGFYVLRSNQLSGKVVPSKRDSSNQNPVKQTTMGPGSPAVQGVNGDVTITMDQSSQKQEAPPTNPPHKAR